MGRLADAWRGATPSRRRSIVAVGCLVLLAGGLGTAVLRNGPVTSIAGGDPGDFAFIETQADGSGPVTYDPCEPIHVVVDPARIVDDGAALLQEALDEVHDASGLTFVVNGDAGEVASGDRPPVTVTWSDPQASPRLEGSVIGYAGSSTSDVDGHRWFVTGSVVLDGPQLAELLDRRDGRDYARATLMHELGHLVGLDHVDEPGQLMQPEGRRLLTTWGEGDLTGLAAVGRGRCVSGQRVPST